MKPKVLIIEDDLLARQAYFEILSNSGYEVSQATNGREGLELAERIEPDLIILDMVMPEMDGITFLKAYDVKNKHPQTKVLVLSNSAAPEKMNETKTLGASKYLIKTAVPPREVIKQVSQLVSLTGPQADEPPA